MKSILSAFFAIALSGMAFNSLAATEVSQPDNLTKIGIVSDSSGALTLGELAMNLSGKADKAGANAYRIISAGGDNHYFGVAEIFHKEN